MEGEVMNTYLVTWEIELDAENEFEAAKVALEIQRDRGSDATFFDVTDVKTQLTVCIDLESIPDVE
jgi:hypothetical protein